MTADHKTFAVSACDAAERVLPLFERDRPGDGRPRRAIEAGRAWVRGDLAVGGARNAAFASHAAAREATTAAAIAAARAAGHAAATAHVGAHASAAEAYAMKAEAAARAPAGKPQVE